MKLRYLLFLAAFSTILIVGCKKQNPSQESSDVETPKAEVPMADESELDEIDVSTPATPEKVLGKATALEGLTYIKGETVKFEEGKFYVVEFWATWCPPCRASIPHLTELQKNFKDAGLTIIGISDEESDTVKKFVEEQGEKMNYTVALDTKGTANKAYMEKFKQRGIPTAFFVNGKGEIVWIGHPLELDEVLPTLIDVKAKAEEAIGNIVDTMPKL